GLRNRDLTSIFEADGEPPRQFVVGDRGADPGDPRRPGEASGTGIDIGRSERDAARLAPALAEELDLLPTIETEAVNVGYNGAAAGATWRKREIERPARGGPHEVGDHLALVARNSASHKRPVPDLFDMELRALRRDRAFRRGAELFLYERAFD